MNQNSKYSFSLTFLDDLLNFGSEEKQIINESISNKRILKVNRKNLDMLDDMQIMEKLENLHQTELENQEKVFEIK